MDLTARRDVPPLLWDGFVASHPDGWFMHTTAWLDYCLAYTPEAKDRSLAAVADGRIVALAPLIDEGGGWAMGGEAGSWPLGVDDDAAAVLWGYITKQPRGAFRQRPEPLSNPGVDPREIVWSTSVVDLGQPEADLWRRMRRSYHALVNRVLKSTDNAVVELGAEAFMALCPDVHYAAAGRVTRSPETWQYQADWIRCGTGRCFAVLRDADTVGHDLVRAEARAFAYVAGTGGWWYYFSGASREPNLMHAVQWTAIMRLKEAGASRYELGWLDRHTSKKDQGIAHFKAGFGGDVWKIDGLEWNGGERHGAF